MYKISLTDNHGNSKSWILQDGDASDADAPRIFKFITENIDPVVGKMRWRTAKFFVRNVTTPSTATAPRE